MEEPETKSLAHGNCLYIPGKIEGGKSINYLLDTGSSDNILSKAAYNRLPARVKDRLDGERCTASMADGSGLVLYGTITLDCRIRTVPAEISFRVANIAEDAILGMKFFTDYSCQLLLDQGVLKIEDSLLPCTNKYGEFLSTRIQVVKQTEIPANSEYQLTCRLINQPAGTTGMVEHCSDDDLGFRIAPTIVQVKQNRHITVRCINPHATPVSIKPGTTVGLYSSITEDQIHTDCTHSSTEETQEVQFSTGSQTHVPPHVQPLLDQALENCSTAAQQKAITDLLVQYSTVFSTGDTDLGVTDLVTHEIPTLPNTQPIKQAPRRLGMEKDAEVDRQVKELLDKGLIEPADSAWSSPVVLVKKKDNSWRLCIDYRRLNDVTRKDAYPLPRIDDSLDTLSGSVWFSTLDLISGYWQLPMSEDASNKAAFATKGGLWRPKRLPFGLTSAPATFERLMEKVLHGLTWNTLLLYLDDVVVFGPDFNTHLKRLATVLERFKNANLKLKPSKCELLKKEVRYLGHIVSSEGVKTDPEKIKAVREWKTPTCRSELSSFLGFVGYYRRFCADYATIASPLNRLTSKKVQFEWNSEADDAFKKLKEIMTTPPTLAYPDPKEQYILDTDASLDGVGAVLSQIQHGEERPIAYYSKTLSSSEKNYCTTRRELLGVVLSVKHFRPYLYGKEFMLRTDHASLQWLYRRKEPSHQVARWLEILAEFKFQLKHRAGRDHSNADGLSRGCVECKQCQRIEDRDGGPTWKQIEGENEQAFTQQIDLTDDLYKEIPELQRMKDSATALIINALEDKKSIDNKVIEAGSPELKTLAEQIHLCKLDDGILKIRTMQNKRPCWVIVCPAPMRSLAIEKTHTQHHAGINKTYKRLRLQWYWPGMSGDVRRMVKTCEVCQAAKNSNHKTTENKQRLFAGRPWQVISIDLVGPLTTTPRGNKMILVLSDHFTRWRDAVPIPDGTAETIADVLDQRIFAYFGLPERIHSDLGTQFESKLMQELCTMWKVQKSRTTSYHPQGNGVVERGNKDLGNALRSLLLTREETDWDKLVPQIMRSLRATPHSMTNETANYMMFGRELNLPDTLMGGYTTQKQTRGEYAQDLSLKLREAHDFIRQQQHQIRQEDTTTEPKFIVGDLVWMKANRHKKGMSTKLQPRYYGPYVVKAAHDNNTYLLQQNNRTITVNEDKLKLHNPSSVDWATAPALEEPSRQPPRMGQNAGKQKSNRQQPVEPSETQSTVGKTPTENMNHQTIDQEYDATGSDSKRPEEPLTLDVEDNMSQTSVSPSLNDIPEQAQDSLTLDYDKDFPPLPVRTPDYNQQITQQQSSSRPVREKKVPTRLEDYELNTITNEHPIRTRPYLETEL